MCFSSRSLKAGSPSGSRRFSSNERLPFVARKSTHTSARRVRSAAERPNGSGGKSAFPYSQRTNQWPVTMRRSATSRKMGMDSTTSS